MRFGIGRHRVQAPHISLSLGTIENLDLSEKSEVACRNTCLGTALSDRVLHHIRVIVAQADGANAHKLKSAKPIPSEDKVADAIFIAILLVMMKSGRFSGRCAQPPFLWLEDGGNGNPPPLHKAPQGALFFRPQLHFQPPALGGLPGPIPTFGIVLPICPLLARSVQRDRP